MGYMDEYKKWLSSPVLSESEKAELAAIAGNEEEIKSRFYAPLSFGTAGLRGILGMGLNRMNVYTVRQATQGMAALICGVGPDAMSRGAAIAYDCRHGSREFAEASACVLAANGIKAWLFDAMRPTPELSFAVRRLKCIAGINITASHNPKEYNGYKAYWEDGAQLPPSESDVAVKAIKAADIFDGVRCMPLDKALKSGLVAYIGKEMDEAFLDFALSQQVCPGIMDKTADELKIVYTPFHGTGYKLVPEALRRMGMKNVILEPRQIIPDGDFPTVKSPNPQDREGFAGAIELARKNDVDLIIGTDPDADRIGTVVRDAGGEYVTLSGNQLGVLLLDYIIRARTQNRTMPPKPAVLKSIVTTEMVRAVADKHGVACYDTFTGFKYLAEKIAQLERTGAANYILAFEESYGYLTGGGCRDKDAVTASVLVTEMAAWYRAKGMTLSAAMDSLYKEYGYFREETLNFVMPGLDGIDKIKNLLSSLRENTPRSIADTVVLRFRDYLPGTITELATGETEKMELSGSQVLYFELEDGDHFVVRPSGTEPKVRVYMLLRGENAETCDKKVEKYTTAAKKMMN